MVRENYFEILDNMSFDPKAELDSLLGLLNKSVYYSTSIYDTISENFLSYKNRLTITNFDEFLAYIWQSGENSTDILFLTSEILNDIFRDFLNVFSDEENKYIEEAIFHNINKFLDLSNHEFLTLESGRQIIVEKNVYASEVSQIVFKTNIQEAIKVLEYNHFANKGNIERKREILKSLADYLEPLRSEINASEELKEVLKVNNKKIISVEKLFEMYNQFGLRHNNTEQYHLGMSEAEIEQWYDDIYTSTLFVILSLNEAQILSRLNKLKSNSWLARPPQPSPPWRNWRKPALVRGLNQ